jgi:hypothetical protein
VTTSSQCEKNCMLHFLSSKHRTSADVFNSGMNAGLTESSCNELLQRGQHGVASNVILEKKIQSGNSLNTPHVYEVC